jgi:hypothetical protein
MQFILYKVPIPLAFSARRIILLLKSFPPTFFVLLCLRSVLLPGSISIILADYRTQAHRFMLMTTSDILALFPNDRNSNGRLTAISSFLLLRYGCAISGSLHTRPSHWDPPVVIPSLEHAGSLPWTTESSKALVAFDFPMLMPK